MAKLAATALELVGFSDLHITLRRGGNTMSFFLPFPLLYTIFLCSREELVDASVGSAPLDNSWLHKDGILLATYPCTPRVPPA